MTGTIRAAAVGRVLACLKAGFFAFALALGSPAVHGQAIEPRSFSNAPIGVEIDRKTVVIRPGARELHIVIAA